jgi:molybdopterin synthase catalytic subunit
MRTFSANEFSIVVSVFSIDRRYSFSGSDIMIDTQKGVQPVTRKKISWAPTSNF